MDPPYEKPLISANFLQKIEAPLATVAKSKIGSDINFLNSQLFPDDPDREIPCTDPGELPSKGDYSYKHDPEFFHDRKLLVEGLDLPRRVVRRQHLQGMRVKRDHGRRAVDVCRAFDQIPDQPLMPEMHAVKIADCRHWARQNWLDVLQAIDDLHVHP